jgi:hypothetical protein
MFTGRCPHCEVPLFKLSHHECTGTVRAVGGRQRLTVAAKGHPVASKPLNRQ